MNELVINRRHGVIKAALLLGWMVAAIAQLQGQVAADPSLLAELG